MPDTCPFHDKDEDVNWSGSLLRQWLNSDFLHRAFSEAERNAIETTSVENAPNSSYDAAVLPALTVELTKASWTVATPVMSTDIVQ